MAEEMPKKKVLFLCTHNSARSQMAEAFLRKLYGNRYEALSAGTEPTRVHPYTVEVMREAGIDLSGQRAKDVAEFVDMEIDEVVTVCDQAKESCPFFPYGKRVLHQGFPDPSSFEGTESEKLAVFRQVRDAIGEWVKRRYAPETEPGPVTE